MASVYGSTPRASSARRPDSAPEDSHSHLRQAHGLDPVQTVGRGHASLFKMTSFTPHSSPSAVRSESGGRAVPTIWRSRVPVNKVSAMQTPQFGWNRNAQWVQQPKPPSRPATASASYRGLDSASSNRIIRRPTRPGAQSYAYAASAVATAINGADERLEALGQTSGSAARQHWTQEQAEPCTPDPPEELHNQLQPPQQTAEVWERVVLPAITWLYGWVEFQVSSTHVPSVVEREHREAFAEAIEAVTDAMRAQPSRLASCIWRATIGLLTHFVSHTEPLQKEIADLKKQHAAALAEVEDLRMQLETLESRPRISGRDRTGTRHLSAQQTKLGGSNPARSKRVEIGAVPEVVQTANSPAMGDGEQPTLTQRRAVDTLEVELAKLVKTTPSTLTPVVKSELGEKDARIAKLEAYVAELEARLANVEKPQR